MNQSSSDCDDLVNEALEAHFSGWDFSWLRLIQDERGLALTSHRSFVEAVKP